MSITIEINPTTTTLYKTDGLNGKPVENKLILLEEHGVKSIIAYGGPRDWASTDPLPEGSETVDLIEVVKNGDELAPLYWRRFIAYHLFVTKPSALFLFRRHLMPFTIKYLVDLQLKDQGSELEMRKCLRSAKLNAKLYFSND